MTNPTPDSSSVPEASVFADASAGLLRARVLDPPRQPGQLASLGRFDILRVIGSGGMGVVLLARDSTSASLVAIKVLRPELIDRADVRHRFLVETRHMQRLSHPNILTISEVSERPEGPYFVMPFIERGSLAGMIRPGEAVDQATTLNVARQVADALARAHAKGIIHRDLKPGNVLVDSQGRAFLTDFGLARRIDVNDSLVDVQREQCEGTCSYMSPEVAEGKAGDTRCDIYSFGAMLYELLTGRPPYAGTTAESILGRIAAGPPDPVLQRNPQAHPGLAAIAEAAMARELRDRYASMADVVADLERVEKSEEPLGPSGRPQPRTGVRLKAGIAIAVALLCLGAVVAVVAHLGHRGGRTLLDEEFLGTTIDAARWKWGEAHGSPRESRGKHDFQVSQQDGSLLVEARVEHESGWISVQSAWVDSLFDLKKSPDNLLIDLEFSANAVGGGVAVMLCTGDAPRRGSDPNSVVLFRAFAIGRNSLSLKDQHVQIEILKAASLAVVSPADNLSVQSQLVDIPKLAAWKLRFFAIAGTSAGFAPAGVQLRLNRMRVSTIKAQSCLVGKVVDSRTNRPIQGVTVRAASIPSTADTGAQGNFILPALSSGRTEVVATAEGYEQVTRPLAADIEPGRHTVIRIVMRRTARARYGEVEESIPSDNTIISGLAVTDRWLYFTARDEANVAGFYRMAHSGVPLTRVSALPGASGLAFANGELYGLDRSPGRLYKIGPDGQSQKIFDLSADWTRGLAFDGALFWFLEVNATQDLHAAYAIDPKTGEVKARFDSADVDLRGIAAETKAGGRLWISSRSGTVYEIDPARIPKDGKMEDGIIREFPGYYSQLSWYGGKLWGVDNEAKRICQIVLQDAPAVKSP